MSHTYPEGASVGLEDQDIDHWTCMAEHCTQKVDVKAEELCKNCRQEEGEFV